MQLHPQSLNATTLTQIQANEIFNNRTAGASFLKHEILIKSVFEYCSYY